MLVGQVGFQRTVPLVLYGTSGIGQTHRIECVGGTGRIPMNCPTCPSGIGGIGRTHRIECVGGTGRIP